MNKVYKANDIAEYVIDYSMKSDNPVSNLKLQKLLYYIQADFLVKKGTPCFSEDIEHWRHGPVIREVYSKYKMYFNDKINEVKEYNKVKKDDMILINEVVDSYSDYGPWQMVKKTHEEEPWVNTNSDDIIDTIEIKEYYKKYENLIFGNR